MVSGLLRRLFWADRVNQSSGLLLVGAIWFLNYRKHKLKPKHASITKLRFWWLMVDEENDDEWFFFSFFWVWWNAFSVGNVTFYCVTTFKYEWICFGNYNETDSDLFSIISTDRKWIWAPELETLMFFPWDVWKREYSSKMFRLLMVILLIVTMSCDASARAK